MPNYLFYEYSLFIFQKRIIEDVKRMELTKKATRIDERYIVRQFAFLQKLKLNQ